MFGHQPTSTPHLTGSFMKRRKLQRNQKKQQIKQQPKNDRIVNAAAESTALAAIQGEATLNCLGNFIFFSTQTGEAWMLDYRKSCALRLAENGEKSSYTILESRERFQVEWKERFRIEEDLFIASRQGRETVFAHYPIDALTRLIRMLKEKERKAGP